MSDGQNNRKYERFGRYLILDHLVDGGMAKICRSRFLGEQADKIVAIKMIQPQFSKDEAFKIMFMNEIKVTFGLLHPNIVQTYDYGVHNDQLFVAMEYCDGRNLKEYLEKLRQRKFVFPVEISVYIITQVCQGLYYAHTFSDKLTGKKANIVHRDISPHNIMLTFDGAVKVIDFGIAKAETNSEKTQAGTIKGKLSYLAPEYLEGKDLDPRYDEFAVGITLWEMLCSRKLFKANNDLAVLKKIQECKIPPPSSINPNVPKELDEIVLKALSKDRGSRFENMDQLNRALIKFLYATYPDFNATDLSYFARELFKDEIKLDREKLFEFGKIDLDPYLNDLRDEKNGVSHSAPKDPTQPKRRESKVLDFGFEEEQPLTKINHDKTLKRDRKDNVKAPAAAKKPGEATKLAGGRAVPPATARPTSAARRQTEASDKGSKAPSATRTNVTEISRRRKKTNTNTTTRTGINKINLEEERSKARFPLLLAGLCVIVGAIYVKKPSLLGLEKKPEAVTKTADNSPASKLDKDGIKDREPSSSEKGISDIVSTERILLLGLDKLNHKVFIDGKSVQPDYLRMVEAPVGKEFYLRVQMPGQKHFVRKMKLNEGEEKRIQLESEGEASYGFLEMSRACIQGQLYFELFGEKRVEVLPIEGDKGIIPFPVDVDDNGDSLDKTYKAYYRIKGDSGNIEREIEFDISEGKMTDLCDSENID